MVSVVTPYASEHYSRIVSPRDWKSVFIQMLTCCFDAAGKEAEPHKILAVAGFASFADIWSEFETRWQDRLTQDGLPYFHAVEFAHSTGIFNNGWKGNETRRRSLQADLFNIIQSCGLRKFGAILVLDDFGKSKQKIVEAGHADIAAYAFAAMNAVEDFVAYAKGEGVVKNVRFVFEKGDPEDDLRKLFREKGYE
jgi:hypothetical protein